MMKKYQLKKYFTTLFSTKVLLLIKKLFQSIIYAIIILNKEISHQKYYNCIEANSKVTERVNPERQK